MPELNTAALPDLIFTILFFFILVTHLRSVDVKLRYDLPEGQQLTKMKERSSILHVYVDADGRTQIENALVEPSQIEKTVRDLAQQPSHSGSTLQVSFKADKKAKMKVVNQVKNELRKVKTIRVNYSARESNHKEKQTEP